MYYLGSFKKSKENQLTYLKKDNKKRLIGDIFHVSENWRFNKKSEVSDCENKRDGNCSHNSISKIDIQSILVFKTVLSKKSLKI